MAGRLRALSPLRECLRTEADGGVLLLAATIAALAWANSPWADSYQDFWHTGLSIGGPWAVREDLQHWANHGLMVGFFFLIGLEIKVFLLTSPSSTTSGPSWSLPPSTRAVSAGCGSPGPSLPFAAVFVIRSQMSDSWLDARLATKTRRNQP